MPVEAPVAAVGYGLVKGKVVTQASGGALLFVFALVVVVTVEVHAVAEAAQDVGVAVLLIGAGGKGDGVVGVGFVTQFAFDAVAVVTLRVGRSARGASDGATTMVLGFVFVVVGVADEAVPLFAGCGDDRPACGDAVIFAAVLAEGGAADALAVLQVVVRGFADEADHAADGIRAVQRGNRPFDDFQLFDVVKVHVLSPGVLERAKAELAVDFLAIDQHFDAVTGDATDGDVGEAVATAAVKADAGGVFQCFFDAAVEVFLHFGFAGDGNVIRQFGQRRIFTCGADGDWRKCFRFIAIMCESGQRERGEDGAGECSALGHGRSPVDVAEILGYEQMNINLV